MQILLKIVLLLCSVIFVACSTVNNLVGGGGKTKTIILDPQLSLAENIGEPLDEKQAEWLSEKVKSISLELVKIPDIRVFTLRNDQVVKLLIPASSLFAPNDSVPKSSVSEILTPVLSQVKSGEFNLIVAGYMDDSGKPDYTHKITELRADAIARWFIDSGVDTAAIITYAFGSEQPRQPNTSVRSRAENRRIELYLLPSQSLLDSQKRGLFRKR